MSIKRLILGIAGAIGGLLLLGVAVSGSPNGLNFGPEHWYIGPVFVIGSAVVGAITLTRSAD